MLRELLLPLPDRLHAFGDAARIAVTGPDDAPLLVLLGGISANRHPARRPDGTPGWWAQLADNLPGHRILGIDFIADEAGTAAPTPADQAEVVVAALDLIGEARARAIVGASYGGMIALAFAEHHAERADRIVVMCADAAPHPTATATRELQRRVVRLGLDHDCAADALGIARGMGMLTYRCPDEFAQRFAGGIDGADPLTRSAPGAYLHARGAAFGEVMSPGRFLSLSGSIDRHRADPARIATPALLIGATTDQLVPPAQMTMLRDRLAGPADLHLLLSLYGHDMFLKEAKLLSTLVAPFLHAS